MDAATLQNRIYKGYGKAALRVGYLAELFRPNDATAPLAEANKVGMLHASFNAEDMGYKKPIKYGDPTVFGLFDGSVTQPGDYLRTSQDGTFFIAAQQTALPILLIKCNAVADFIQPQKQSGVGALGYGGTTTDNQTPVMTNWPCAIHAASKGDRMDMVLPGDTKTPWFNIYVPAILAVTLRAGDIVKDNLNRRYTISSAERSDLGWRINAAQVQT